MGLILHISPNFKIMVAMKGNGVLKKGFERFPIRTLLLGYYANTDKCFNTWISSINREINYFKKIN